MTALSKLLRQVPVSVLIALGFFIVCALFVPRFSNPGNLENVARIAAILAVVACGQAIVLVLGGIELSFGSSVALASVVTVMLLPATGPFPAFLAGIAVVVLAGVLNATLVAGVGLPAVVVTLGTLMIGHGLAASLAGGLPIDAAPSPLFRWPAVGEVLGIPVAVVFAAIALFCLWVLLAHTELGRRFYLVGANASAARLSGIGVKGTVFTGYILAGLFAGVASVILTSRVGSGQPNLMPDLPFQTIAACAIGGIPLTGGRGSVVQVIAGVAIIAILNNAVVLLNYPVAIQQLLIALVIVVSVVTQRLAAGLAFDLQILFKGAKR
jgi:ribose/xylose/arabinose/galactoside ABC-type transport system permease subunit